MKIIVNATIINNKRAGIGNYGYNLISNLVNEKDVNFTFILQKCIKIDYNNVHYTKNYIKSYQRIIDEQLFLPLKYRKYDLVHFIDYSSPIINIGIPFIVTIHDLSFYKYPEMFSQMSRTLKQRLTPLSIKRASLIIADSNSTRNDIIEYFQTAAEKIRVIYPGKPNFRKINDITIVENIKNKYGIKGRYILGVCTLEPRKNLKRLVQAFEIIYKYYNDIYLVLVGQKGWLYDDLMLKIENSFIKDRIITTGYISKKELECIYSGAEVFVYPSLYEGFGLPPLEAMCCGVPVVVSNSSSLPEVVGDAGIYCDPYSIESIAESVLSILKNQEIKKHLSIEGIKRSEKFSWQKAAQKVMEAYREILE
ncbi:Glycosyltransferase involved in cell wall bisynthesis [Caloramator quimbayensis]|uniref:Glycosyltransferase involved in cell wall bisynthesis n=1 Tax=Caloramator quimbayensis TaxID=1147123 RepID=A0A1T4WI34_9CLOT|nr:glycosyltransferase family 1 protein [Caloramator quimbayensis]SKA76598.1 Glycosyltransferase involved in cell wall bisynthesis [Caloramator quimbayensis]